MWRKYALFLLLLVGLWAKYGVRHIILFSFLVFEFLLNFATKKRWSVEEMRYNLQSAVDLTLWSGTETNRGSGFSILQ